jgi:hypothetical protein
MKAVTSNEQRVPSNEASEELYLIPLRVQASLLIAHC